MSFTDPENGLSWTEFWATPTRDLNRFADALLRRNRRREAEHERQRRRG